MFRHSNSAARLIMALAAVIFVVPTVMPAAGISLQDFSDSFEDVSKKVTPAVVQIYTTGYGPAQSSGVAPITIQRGTGSGIILDPNGYIITNAHVVELARQVKVLIPVSAEEKATKKSILKVHARVVGGQVVGVDHETDLAVIKVQEKDLPYLELALRAYYRSERFLHFAVPPQGRRSWGEVEELLWQEPCVAQTLRNSPYLEAIFHEALLGVPRSACQAAPN